MELGDEHYGSNMKDASLYEHAATLLDLGLSAQPHLDLSEGKDYEPPLRDEPKRVFLLRPKPASRALNAGEISGFGYDFEDRFARRNPNLLWYQI